MKNLIEVKNLTKKYQNKIIFENISFSIEKNSIFCLAGKSGVGKTTLMKILSTLDFNYSGSVLIDDLDIKKLNGNSLAKFRNKQIGIVFQDNNLLSDFTCFENICIPGYINREKKSVEKDTEKLMEELSISDCKNLFPKEISAGQIQRVSFARALINSPKIIFADEPTGNLDEHTSNQIHQMILNLKKNFNQTFFIVTHSKDMMKISDKIFDFENFLKKQ